MTKKTNKTKCQYCEKDQEFEIETSLGIAKLCRGHATRYYRHLFLYGEEIEFKDNKDTKKDE